MKITKYNGNANMYHNLKRPKIDYIVIHYTASTQAEKGTAYAICNMFNKPETGASADYVVDKEIIMQYNTKPHKQACWAVGGDKYTVMSTTEGGKFYGKCTNQNSISIEMCSAKINKRSVKTTDMDWYIPKKVRLNTVWLVRKLMKRYDIDINHVIMHHHVTGKWCPQPWVRNQGRLKRWRKFKKEIMTPISGIR